LTQFNGIGLQIEHTENRTHTTLLTGFYDCDVVFYCYGQHCRFISDNPVLLRCGYENAPKAAGDASVLAMR
ncbi:hypothetical protein, partial [Klebsiella aerogenes]|uniref:hypothetical protein n=1 Tax=Klebsiella aerogenes TaxID=548 RepID=UPI0019547169